VIAVEAEISLDEIQAPLAEPEVLAKPQSAAEEKKEREADVEMDGLNSPFG